jgi:hypothetical protein
MSMCSVTKGFRGRLHFRITAMIVGMIVNRSVVLAQQIGVTNSTAAQTDAALKRLPSASCAYPDASTRHDGHKGAYLPLIAG